MAQQRFKRRRRKFGSQAFRRRNFAPAEMFVASFLLLIVGGSLALLIMPGLYQGEGLGLTDAIFTATSAVCVTGLIVVDTATHFTFLGQLERRVSIPSTMHKPRTAPIS